MNPLSFSAGDKVVVSDPQTPWKVLIVDDADEVRAMTKLALDGFLYRGRGLELLEASSADEAKKILNSTADVAVAIIDVVMETDHAGLDLVRWIRKEKHNPLIRLLIRTGQAGMFPASKVIEEYEINDYWEKTELTYSRLHTAMTTSLRGYDDLSAMHRRTLQLRQWADRFPDLLGVRDWNSLLRLVMLRLRELFPRTPLSAFLCRNDGRRWPLISGTGDFPPEGASDIAAHLDESRAAVLLDAWDRKSFSESENAQALYFEVFNGEGHLFFLELPVEWEEYEKNVSRLVLQNFRAVLENRTLINDLERNRGELANLLRKQEDVTRDLHHRFQTSIQVVLSFIEIESTDRTGLSGRTALAGAQRRLHVLGLLHALMYKENRLSGLDFQPLLRALVDHERTHRSRPGTPEIEYWGVPVDVELEKAVTLALATVEMIDLVQSPRFRTPESGPVQLILSDNPRLLSVGREGLALNLFTEGQPLEWKMVRKLAEQVGGKAEADGGFLRLSF